MRLLHETIGLFIAILGVMVIVSSETEDRKYRIVENVNHRNEDSISINGTTSNRSSNTTNDRSNYISAEYRCNRCVGKFKIEVAAHPAKVTENAIIKMDVAEFNMFSNRKWTNITITSRSNTSKIFEAVTKASTATDVLLREKITQKHNFLLPGNQKSRTLIIPSEVEQDNRNRVKRSDRSFQEFPRPENLTQAIPDSKPRVDESVGEAVDTLIPVSLLNDETIRDDTINEFKEPSKKHPSKATRNQLDDSDRQNLAEATATSTSTSTATIKVLSAKQIFPSTLNTRNSDASTHSGSNRLVESTLEVPLILEPQVLGASMWVSKNASQDDDENHDLGNGHPYFKKDHSKPSINLVDGKPSKVFYEIKPSLNTAMDEDDVPRTWAPATTTKRSFLAGFKIPSIPSSFGKYGPYFLDDVDGRNITERIGSTVLMDCRIGLLGDKKVTWLQHDKDSIRLLTVGNVQYSADERISLKFQYPDNWRLQITYATLRDNGLYKCQVEIDPAHSLVKRYNVIITAPVLNITDDAGRAISGERHLKAGSALRLRCEGRDVLEKLNESLLWTRGDEILTSYVSENRTTEIVDDKEVSVIVSALTIEKASPRHAGNYSCIVPERAKSTIAVHVLNGELPAAVHGSGVSRAVLNIWLVHLTISSGFFR